MKGLLPEALLVLFASFCKKRSDVCFHRRSQRQHRTFLAYAGEILSALCDRL